MQAEIVVQLSNGAFIDDLYILYCGIMHQMILSWLAIFLTTIVTIVLQKKKKKNGGTLNSKIRHSATITISVGPYLSMMQHAVTT